MTEMANMAHGNDKYGQFILALSSKEVPMKID